MTVTQFIAREVVLANQELLAKEAEAFRSYKSAIEDAELDENVARNLLAERAAELEQWRRQALEELHRRLAEILGAGVTRN